MILASNGAIIETHLKTVQWSYNYNCINAVDEKVLFLKVLSVKSHFST